MDILGSEGELSSGFKHVPWSNWDQWIFVKDSIFSPSPDCVSGALQRISAWRSRGCLPVPIDVTAAIVEIQQKDPYFRSGKASDVLNSEELLAMLYCMAIMRLVNCFVEPAHKKTGRSISELADAVGIPRMLVDIRHESSHRNLPSLCLVRTASTKALDWLKSNYWEPQSSAIPDVRKEVRLRLREMNFYLKAKQAQRSSSIQSKGKRIRSGVLMRCNKLSSLIAGKQQASKSDDFDRRISKISKIIVRLYSSYPTEVVAVFFEFFQLQATDVSDDSDMECSDDSNVDDLGPHQEAMCDLKMITSKLSNKAPGLILSILKRVLEMIEAKESVQQTEKGGCHFLSSKYQSEMADITCLCSLVHWLVRKLKLLKDTGRIGILHESPELLIDSNASTYVSLTQLLLKVLSLSVVGDKNLSSAVLLLIQMIGNGYLTAKLKKIPFLVNKDRDFIDNESTFSSTESMLLKEEACIKKATEKLEFLKLNLEKRRTVRPTSTDRVWSVTRSWTPCPIGMLPCSFSSAAVLPVLDKAENTLEIETDAFEAEVQTNIGCVENACVSGKRVADGNIDENEIGSKRSRLMLEEQSLDSPEIAPMEGQLLIGGVWKKVREEELLDIELNIKTFTELIPKQ